MNANIKNNTKNKKKSKKAKISFAKEILISILENTLDCAETFVKAFEHPRERRNSCQCGKEKRHIKKELSQLKQREYLEERKRGDSLELCLTDKGKKEALRYKIIKCEDYLKDKYCLVAFDIPETQRNIRNFFRAFLKEAEFVQLQQSVWITQKDIIRHLDELIHLAEAEKWIRTIEADYISNFSFDTKKARIGKDK